MQLRSRQQASTTEYGSFVRTFHNPATGETKLVKTDQDYSAQVRRKTSGESFELTDPLNDKPTRSTWNGFQHYKCWSTFSTLSSRFGITDAGGVFPTWVDSLPFAACRNLIATSWGSEGNPTVGLYPLMFGPDAQGRFISAVPDEGEMVSIAIKRFAPIIRPELQSFVSAIELKDFGSLKRTANRIVQSGSWLKALQLISKQVPTRSRTRRLFNGVRGSLRSLLGSTSDGYLQYAFNLAPLLSDIAGVNSAARSTHQKVSNLLANEGKLIRRHTSFNFASRFDDVVDTMTGYPVMFDAKWTFPSGEVRTFPLYGGVSTVRRTPEYSLARLNAEIEYTYDFGDLTRANAQLLGHLDSLGMGRNPVKDLWELVPWSFVVDWMVGIGRYLDRLDSPLLKPRIAVYRFCFSTTVHRSTTIDFSVGPRSGTELDNCDGGGAGRYVTVVENAYKRVIIDPNTVVGGLTTSGLSPKEVTLATALLLSRNRRRSKR